ncbi:MAG: hypothetical protein OHK0032_16890 [Thermodesulfovibrionales bacterium]
MHTKSNIICPHLIGSPEGAACNVTNNFIRDMGDADTMLCMSRRYEICALYVLSLRRTALNAIESEVILRPGNECKQA